MYTQCEMKNVSRVLIAYIPSKYAIAGKAIKLKADGEWVDGWIVERVFQSVSDDFVIDHRDDYREFSYYQAK